MKPFSSRQIIIFCSILVLLSGCGATLKTNRIPYSKIKKVDKGLAVNQPTPHEIIVIFPEVSVSKNKLVQQKTRQFLTSSTELYTINYSGALFATRQLEVDLHWDSSPKRVKVSSAQEIPAALEDLAAASKSAGEIRKGLKTPPEDPLIKENTSLELQLRNLMLQANIRAIELALEPPYPGI